MIYRPCHVYLFSFLMNIDECVYSAFVYFKPLTSVLYKQKLSINKLESRGTDTLSGEATLSKLFCLSSEKWSILKEKNLLPLGANSFLLE